MNDEYKYVSTTEVSAGRGVRKDEPGDSLVSNAMVRNECVGDEDLYYDSKWQISAQKRKTPNCIDRSAWLQNTSSKYGKIYLNDDNEDLILQILVGNGGRVLDPLFSDKFSDMLILYGNTGFNTHGYSVAEFSKDKGQRTCRIKYFGFESDKADAKVIPRYTLDVVLLDGKNKIAKRKDLLNKSFKVDVVSKLKDKYKP